MLRIVTPSIDCPEIPNIAPGSVFGFASRKHVKTRNPGQLRVNRTGTGSRRSEEYEMRAVLRIVQVLIVAATAVAGSCVEAADANHGADLAKRWCAACHVVDSGQTQASADVATFATIASKADFSPEKVAFFLLDPHPKMPSFPLSRTEAADIAAYISSLRK
jgi:mono/diheme cytochrome c family protein